MVQFLVSDRKQNQICWERCRLTLAVTVWISLLLLFAITFFHARLSILPRHPLFNPLLVSNFHTYHWVSVWELVWVPLKSRHQHCVHSFTRRRFVWNFADSLLKHISESPKNSKYFLRKMSVSWRRKHSKLPEREKEMAEGGRKDKLGGRDRDTGKVFPEWCWG